MSGELSISNTSFNKINYGYLKSNNVVSNNSSCIFTDNNSNSTQDIDYLFNKLDDAKENDGIFTSLWDKFKGFVNLGSSSSKCEKAIEDYKEGKIDFCEVESMIDKFDSKQKDSLNLFANIVTGVASVAVISSAFLTGGLPLALLGAAGVGALSKTGIKFLDRATNNLKGDAADKKEILKDALTGALDGAVSVATMGFSPYSVSLGAVTKQSLKQTAIQGFSNGAKSGAISGAITGAGDYTINTFVDDSEFNFGDFTKNTVMTAAFGGLTGGIFEGISGSIQYKSNLNTFLRRKEQFPSLDDDTIIKLSSEADYLKNSYIYNDIVEYETHSNFDNVDSIVNISARVKGNDSIFSKLANKYSNAQLNEITHSNCFEAITDAYGARLQLKSLSTDDAADIINNFLKDSPYDYNDYLRFLNNEQIDLTMRDYFKKENKNILNILKEKQTNEAFTALLDAIDNKRLNITELNNYGDEFSSYFTDKQINQIADTYYNRYNKTLTVVTDISNIDAKGAKITLDDEGNTILEFENLIVKEKNAIKKSGYASSQMNTVYDFGKGKNGLGELQIRGAQLNEFADAEHVPYDIRSGKIVRSDKKYSSIYEVIKSMSKKSFNKYNEYLTSVYHYYRLKELGININTPTLSGRFFTAEGDEITNSVVNLLSSDALIQLKNTK